jgi:predicted small lipoprotein YifL
MRKNISILVSLLILSLTACSDKGQYFEESGYKLPHQIQGQANPNR